MAENLQIKITKETGIILKTAGKYCEQDIQVSIDESLLGGESGVPLTVVSATDMDSTLANATASDYGKVYQYTGETTEAYEQGAYYLLTEE